MSQYKQEAKLENSSPTFPFSPRNSTGLRSRTCGELENISLMKEPQKERLLSFYGLGLRERTRGKELGGGHYSVMSQRQKNAFQIPQPPPPMRSQQRYLRKTLAKHLQGALKMAMTGLAILLCMRASAREGLPPGPQLPSENAVHWLCNKPEV